jgi:hypothetical protein
MTPAVPARLLSTVPPGQWDLGVGALRVKQRAGAGTEIAPARIVYESSSTCASSPIQR